jgi:hypothetical protein
MASSSFDPLRRQDRRYRAGEPGRNVITGGNQKRHLTPEGAPFVGADVETGMKILENGPTVPEFLWGHSA